jgi:putative addiction module killer protein
MDAKPRTIESYIDVDGGCPFETWMDGLRGQKIHGIIINRMERARKGLWGDTGSVGEGVHEFRIDFGPGYRIYFGNDGDKIILLSGDTKNGQSRDIAAAKENWRNYNA